MISSTSNNFVVLQSDCKKQVIAKNRWGVRPPRPPLKSASVTRTYCICTAMKEICFDNVLQKKISTGEKEIGYSIWIGEYVQLWKTFFFGNVLQKKHRQENRKLDIQYESANKRSSCRYQQNITNERSKTFTKNETKYELNENKIPNCRRANKIHLTQNI